MQSSEVAKTSGFFFLDLSTGLFSLEKCTLVQQSTTLPVQKKIQPSTDSLKDNNTALFCGWWKNNRPTKPILQW